MDDPNADRDELISRVRNWLGSEGYPLEFRVANLFRAARLPAAQGRHVQDPKTNSIREVDVVAQLDLRRDGLFFRAYFVVECKWSHDKPWVVFGGGNPGMGPSACINQTISSKLGQAVMWVLAGDPDIAKLGMFRIPEFSGFGGRKAFTKGGDHFYSALQGVVSAAVAMASLYDDRPNSTNELPDTGAVVFPLVVVDGELFQASYNVGRDDLDIEPAPSVRVHWRGAEAYRRISTVDVVRADSLGEFVAARRVDMEVLLDRAAVVLQQLAVCFREKRLDPLVVLPASRGTIGLPPLILTLKRVVAEHALSANADEVRPTGGIAPSERSAD
jgi:hypothetical protein